MKIQKTLRVLTLSLIACGFVVTSFAAVTAKQAEAAAAEQAKKQERTMHSTSPAAEATSEVVDVKKVDPTLAREEAKKLEAQRMQEQKSASVTSTAGEVKVQEVKRPTIQNEKELRASCKERAQKLYYQCVGGKFRF